LLPVASAKHSQLRIIIPPDTILLSCRITLARPQGLHNMRHDGGAATMSAVVFMLAQRCMLLC
jgi:hypothetical protein